MKRLSILIASFAFACLGASPFCAPISAQSVVGSGVVKGRSIDILSDNTWRYVGVAKPTTDSCTLIKTPVRFCNSGGPWTSTKSISSDISAQYRYDDRHYGIFIVEDLGSEDGVTLEFMRETLLATMARASGTQPSEVEVLENTSTKIDGKESSLLIYRGTISGLPVVYANTIVLDSKHTYQIISSSIGKAFTPADRQISDDLVRRTKLQ